MTPRVLLVDDDQTFVGDLVYHLGDRFEWEALHSGERLIEVMKEALPDVVLLDIDLGSGPDGLDMLSRIRNEIPRTPVIMVTRHDPRDMAAKAWRLGAFGYVEKSSRMDQLAAQLERAIEEAMIHRENVVLREEVAFKSGRLIGQSASMQALREKIARVAQTTSTVLITGETGTGKELIAREIHDQSSRKDNLFIPVCCPAIPETLVESELFGHEKGAFTGATGRRIGKFELANRGTIFLDEIAEIGPAVQAKLLRILQDHRLQRVGGSQEMEIDVRVIAATNRDLEEEAARGRFRQDLFYRLRVVPLHSPPLREKKEDIPVLVQYILDKKAREMNLKRSRLTSAALDRLLLWDWPGNVRELENVLENALVHATGDTLGEELFAGLVGPGMARLTYADAKERMLERFERDYLKAVLSECGWNVSEAARRMSLSREGLRKLMKRRGIERPDAAGGTTGEQ
jgi:DNA-binding NtrC family response regulator